MEASAFVPSSKSVDALRAYSEGLELSRQGNNLEAVKKFEAATSADPKFALAFTRLGQAYASLGYDKQAEQGSSKAVDLSNDLPPAEKYMIQAFKNGAEKLLHKESRGRLSHPWPGIRHFFLFWCLSFRRLRLLSR